MQQLPPARTAGRAGDSKGKAPVGAAPEGAPAELAVLQHSKVINSAYFSPITGAGGAACPWGAADAPECGCS